MMTLRQFSAKLSAIPANTGWYLADLGESLGKQELYTRQSPQKLKALREHALIESAVSSNRIEGVEVEQKRIATLMFGKPLLKDRDEQEVRGYRDALELCSRGWHEGKHDPWPFNNYVLWILRTAYKEFEQRVAETAEPRGATAAMVREAVARRRGEFRITDIELACPGVGREWIRTVLAEMQQAGEVTCTGRGPAARWRRVEK